MKPTKATRRSSRKREEGMGKGKQVAKKTAPAPKARKPAKAQAKGPAVAIDPGEPLPVAQWERFVALQVSGELSQSEAYLAVYGGTVKRSHEGASRLMRRAVVRARRDHLVKLATEATVKEVVFDKAEVVRRCLTVLETPITLVAHAVAKHQGTLLAVHEGQEVPEKFLLSPEEEIALRLAHELAPSEYGPKVKMVGKMDSLKLIVDTLGLKASDEDNKKNGQGMVDALGALVKAVRARGDA